MEKLKRILHRILYPGRAAAALSVPAGAGLLAYTFLYAVEQSPIAYVAYILSAYSLLLVCVYSMPLIRRGKDLVYSLPLVRRYFEDISFKLQVSLRFSLVVNLFYAGMHGVSGVLNRSVWFGTLAAYYIFLSVIRFLLVRYACRHGFGENWEAEWKRYRLCGVILMMMNTALAGVVILVLHQKEGFHYGGTMIYAVALYTFYITIMAVVNVVRYRKYHSPVMSAARAVNLAAALVSMLSLETAMLTQFDNGNHPFYFRQAMIGSTGGTVCAAVVGMGLYMSVHAARQLKNCERSA